MNYLSSKFKIPGSKQGSSLNPQDGFGGASYLVDEWNVGETYAPMVLQDRPRAGNGVSPFNLLERTAVFGENVVKFSRTIPRSPTNDRLIAQLVGAGTSVGANFCEASEAESKKDFIHSLSRCAKEAKETKFFLRMVVASEHHLADAARPLYREAHELLLIFGAIRRKRIAGTPS